MHDPLRPGEVLALLPLEDVAASTFGNGEHSVTLIADDALTSVGLAKSVVALGLDDGMRLIESQAGVDAVVVDAEGEVHYSSGLRTMVACGTARRPCISPLP